MTFKRVKTNNIPRPVLYFFDLLPSEQEEVKDDYDGVEESTFFRYLGRIYDLSDFPRWDTPWTGSCPPEYDGWQAYDATGGGLLIKLTDDCDALIVGSVVAI